MRFFERFSYPAAYGQSTVQRRSCGTWKLGFICSRQSLDFDYTRLPEPLVTGGETGVGLYDELKFSKIKYYDYSINFGYAYNWVFAPNMLCSVSLAPAAGCKSAKGEASGGRGVLFKRRTFNFDTITRMGLVWNTNRFFLGASSVVHFYNYNKSRFSVNNAIAVVNVYAGVNFAPKEC